MTDLNSGTQLCKNCGQDINKASFMMHEIFCLKNIVKCDKCQKPYDKKNKQEHFEEFHSKVKCECGEEVEKMLLDIHKEETCKKRQAQCFYCDLSLDFEKFEEHLNFCGSRTEQCTKCAKYVQIKDKNKHLNSNCAYPPPVQQPKISSIGAKSSSSRSNDRKLFNRETKASNDVLLPCEFCNKSFSEEELILHQSLCGNSNSKSFMVDYENNLKLNKNLRNLSIDDEIDFSDFHDTNLINHKREDINEEKIPCEICDELISLDDLAIHQLSCLDKINRLDDTRKVLEPVISDYDETNRNRSSLTNPSSTNRILPSKADTKLRVVRPSNENRDTEEDSRKTSKTSNLSSNNRQSTNNKGNYGSTSNLTSIRSNAQGTKSTNPTTSSTSSSNRTSYPLINRTPSYSKLNNSKK